MSQVPEQPHPGALQHEAEHTRASKKNSVLFYLVILFAAAFILLLLSYFMQQRANQENLSNLQQTSSSAVQTLDNLLQDNQDLKAKVTALEKELTLAQSDLTAAESSATNAEEKLDHAAKQRDAILSLNTVRALYNQQQYRAAREYLATQEEKAPGQTEQYLQTIVDEMTEAELDLYNPLEAYQALVKWLSN